jgi:hypothetical protein
MVKKRGGRWSVERRKKKIFANPRERKRIEE